MTKVVNPKDRFDVRLSTNAFSEDDAKKLFLHETPDAQLVSVTKLSGGFSNSNFLIKSSIGSYVIRFYPSGSEACSFEADILQLASKHSIAVPRVVKEKIQFNNHSINILKYVDGTSLSDLLFEGVSIPTHVFYEIGKELAHIHSVPFERSGLLGPRGEVVYDTGDSYKVFNDFILAPLEGSAGKRLGLAKLKIIKLFEKSWPQIGTVIKPCLVHCDFNPKNILVSPTMDKVTIIDWEFAMAGEKLIDFGNFFRFESDYSESMKSSFLKGYESVLGQLPSHWQLTAKIHDLISMIHFLDSNEERPKTFATALKIIEDTLASMKSQKMND